MKKWILRIVLIFVLLAVVGLYIFEVFVNKTPPTKNLFRFGSILLLTVIAFLRTFQVERRSLDFYEQQYSDILSSAFTDQPFWRKKLLCAVRLYNESNYQKALDYLSDMRTRAHSPEDHYAVNLFAALCFTDSELYEHAAAVYQQLINARIADSRIFSNLGHVQMKMGEYRKALQNYELSLDYDRKNEYALNNIAQAHFQMYEFEEAIPFALRALDVNPKMLQASSLLAIIYTLLGDKANAEKYFHIAISSGYSPEDLKEAIDYYRTAQHITDDQINTSDGNISEP